MFRNTCSSQIIDLILYLLLSFSRLFKSLQSSYPLRRRFRRRTRWRTWIVKSREKQTVIWVFRRNKLRFSSFTFLKLDLLFRILVLSMIRLRWNWLVCILNYFINWLFPNLLFILYVKQSRSGSRRWCCLRNSLLRTCLAAIIIFIIFNWFLISIIIIILTDRIHRHSYCSF